MATNYKNFKVKNGLDVGESIVLNSGSGNTSGSAGGVGITIQDAVDASTDASITWDATNDEFDFSHGVSINGNLNVDGTLKWGSGLPTDYYTYSNMDSGGLYIETVDNDTDRASMRFQTRVNNTGSYTAFKISADDQSFLFQNGIANFNRDVRSNGQIRATGWYGDANSTDYTGLATEIGVSSSTGHILVYNRDTSTYGNLNIHANTIKLDSQNGTAIDLVDGLKTGGTVRLSSAGVLSNVTNTNWDTAYGWGNHAGLYELVTEQTATNINNSGTDMLSLDDGWYKWNSTKPTDAPFNYASMLQITESQKIQMAFGSSSRGRLAIRRADSGTFYDWTTFWSDADFSSTDISNWDAAYTYSGVGHLPLTGGTLTGNLTVQNGTPYLILSDNDNSYGGGSTHGIQFKTTGGNIGYVGTDNTSDNTIVITNNGSHGQVVAEASNYTGHIDLYPTNNVRIKSGDLQIGTTTVIDSSRNLTNIGSIAASGQILGSSGFYNNVDNSYAPISDLTLVSGGSGFIDGVYTNVIVNGGSYGRMRVTVSSGVVTLVELQSGGYAYVDATEVDQSNQLNATSGSTGSGFTVTIAVQESLIHLYGNPAVMRFTQADSSSSANQEIGSVRFAARDASTDGGGDVAMIVAKTRSTSGGGYLDFYTSYNGGEIFNGTHQTHTMQLLDGGVYVPNRLYVGDILIQESSDRADLLQIKSNTTSWGGIQITNSNNEGLISLMVNGADHGLYDDENDEWIILKTENGATQLQHGSATKFATTSTGIDVTGVTDSSTGFAVNGTTVIDSSRGLRNITNINNAWNTQVIELDHSTYTIFCDSNGSRRMYLGDNGDPGNYYDNTTHYFRAANNSTVFARINSSGFTTSGDVTAYGSPSDETLKENIELINNAIDKVKQLRGVTFNYIGDENKMTGLIAQDLQKVLPEVVYTTDDDKLAVRYGNTVGLLVEAIKEQQNEIDELKQLVKQLLEK